MKKRILSILLTLCMVICFVPTGVFAEDIAFKNVASAAELKNALADSSVPGIRLTKDIVTDEAFSVTRTVTLDLNGYMLKMTGNDSVIRVEKKNQKIGDLTLIDSRPTTEHRFKADDKNGRWQLDENGDMLVNGGIITSTGTEQRSGGGGVAVSADTKFTMTGGNIVGCDSDKLGSGVYVSFGTFTMTGGRIVGCGNDPGIYLEVWAIMNANGGEVDATVALRENSKITTRDDLAGVTVFRKKVDVFDADSYGVVKYGLFYVPPSNGTPREIVYMANGALYAVQIMPYQSSNLAVEPEIPTSNTGSTFLGWYKADGTKWDFTRDVVNDHICVAARWDTAQQFSGVEVGKTYYFDLSGENIPGTVNANLPDTTLHYVPFTYVGTLDGYVLKPASGGVPDSSDKAANTTDSSAPYGHAYLHSLFIADHILTTDVSYDTLNAADYIFGNSCTVNDVDYTLRAPTIGNTYASSSSQGIPENNEWDQILFKDSGFIKNLLLATPSWSEIWAWGQDTNTSGSIIRSVRSGRNQLGGAPTRFDTHVGFRPVLELPTGLAADNLKVVELRTVKFMPGEQQNWINIIVKKGESFTAPSAEGLPLSDSISADTPMRWVDENLNFYKPGDTVPADVSELYAFYGGLGLFLDRGDGEVEVTPDNYSDIFGDGTASFVLPKGGSLTELEGPSYNLTLKDILGIYSTGRLEKYGSVFPNLKLKNADLTSVRLSEEYIGYGSPLFITADGKNTVGSLNGISMSRDTLSILGNGSLTLNGALTLVQYTQFGGGSVTMTDGLTAYYLSIDSGSLTVTGDTQAITLRDQALGDLYMGDGVRLFTGSSAQDAAEADVPELSAEMQEVYQRYLADDNTLTNEEFAALNNALREQFNAIFRQLPGKTYVRFTNAWDVTYQPGENGDGNAVTDIKFYNDILTLRGKLFARTGYTQTGWATVDGGEKVYGFDAVYTQNEALTLYPVWNTNKYTITFDTAGGSEIAPITQDYGTNITATAAPTREGYTFIGWDREIPKTMPAENITLTARWKDIEKPTGEMKINENSWKAFLNNITFGLFFKDTQTVTITAADNSGETVTVEYLLSAKELTKAELDGMTFTAYTAPFGIDPDNEYIIYVRLTDKAGNTDYICSDGIVLDGTSPVITGIENGKTYCEAQTVTITEKYVDTVTVNGTAVTLDENGSFVLSPADGEQKIVAADKAGNTAEMTVTVNDGHTFGEWTSNGDGTHTRQCTADGCTEGVETDNCIDEDKNHKCDICDYIISECADTDKNHICDICGNIISNHEDADDDHVCDYCGKTISNHEDADNNHICDYCDKVISNHEDANQDHVCDHCGKVISNHEDANKDHVCDLCGKVITNHIGGNKTCRDKAVCEVCGKSYGKLDPNNHTDLKHFPAKAATEDSEGNIEYWYCSGCNKYYRGKDGTKEIAKADTVTAKLPKSPPTGDNSNLMLWIALLFISGGICTALTVKRKKTYRYGDNEK